MKILLLVDQHGFGFINQATALSKGLDSLNTPNKVIHIGNTYPEEEIRSYHPDIILSVGSWRSYFDLVEKPIKLGYRTIPWIVSDDFVGDDLVTMYNSLPLILTTSEYCKKTLVAGGFDIQKLRVLYEAVDDSFWKPLPQTEIDMFINYLSLSTTLQSPTTDFAKLKSGNIPIIYTTGGDATSKGAQEVMLALSELKHLPWIYMIKTWPSEHCFSVALKEFDLAEKLGIYDRIKYISGEFSKTFMLGLMNVCDIYTSPSRKEGFGLALVEAQMCGKPVITMNGTATRETVLHGETGFVVNADKSFSYEIANVAELKTYFEEILTDKDTRIRLGRNALTVSRAKFNPKAAAETLLRTIDRSDK